MSAASSPSGPLRGSLRPPADKSISHRAALIAAMGEGETDDRRLPRRRRHPLDPGRGRGASGRGSRSAERDDGIGARDLRIAGVGLRGAGPASIDVGNAGTLLRLLPGWLAGQAGASWTLDGDDSIRRRPVDRIAEPLREMGARLSAREDRLPPLRDRRRAAARDHLRVPVASAQVKSCLLFAGLLAEGETRVVEPLPSRDHTERMLAAAGRRGRAARATRS